MNIRVPLDTRQRIDRAADLLGISKTEVIVALLNSSLDELDAQLRRKGLL